MLSFYDSVPPIGIINVCPGRKDRKKFILYAFYIIVKVKRGLIKITIGFIRTGTWKVRHNTFIMESLISSYFNF